MLKKILVPVVITTLIPIHSASRCCRWTVRRDSGSRREILVPERTGLDVFRATASGA